MQLLQKHKIMWNLFMRMNEQAKILWNKFSKHVRFNIG